MITDDRGHFSVPKLVAGYVHIEAVIPENSIYRQASSENNEFEGAKKIEITVPLERWAKVHGVVRERGTGKPVEDAGIRFGNARMVGPIILVGRTDAAGRFEAIAPRGKETFCHPDIPKGYLKLSRGIEMPEITGDGQELPPIELERGVTLRGIVVDEMGKPVTGASAWKVEPERSRLQGPQRRDDDSGAGFSEYREIQRPRRVLARRNSCRGQRSARGRSRRGANRCAGAGCRGCA